MLAKFIKIGATFLAIFEINQSILHSWTVEFFKSARMCQKMWTPCIL